MRNTVKFRKIGTSKTLSQKIYLEIEKAILDKKFLPGDKIPTEKELCDMFGVSRTALREAIQMLRSQGLVTIKKGSGIFVNDYSSKFVSRSIRRYLDLNFDKNYVLYVIEARELLEPKIALLAAQNRTEEDISILEENLRSLKNCDPDDTIREGKLDRDFHLKIAQASKNPIMPIILDPINRLMPKINAANYAGIKSAKDLTVTYHGLIVEKIKEQDAQGAYNTMKEHLRIARQHSEEMLQILQENE